MIYLLFFYYWILYHYQTKKFITVVHFCPLLFYGDVRVDEPSIAVCWRFICRQFHFQFRIYVQSRLVFSLSSLLASLSCLSPVLFSGKQYTLMVSFAIRDYVNCIPNICVIELCNVNLVGTALLRLSYIISFSYRSLKLILYNFLFYEDNVRLFFRQRRRY